MSSGWAAFGILVGGYAKFFWVISMEFEGEEIWSKLIGVLYILSLPKLLAGWFLNTLTFS